MGSANHQPNPFASPLADDALPGESTADVPDAERIRAAYLSHEASLRSIGALCYLGAAYAIFAIVGVVAATGRLLSGGNHSLWMLAGITGILLCVVLSGLHAWVGYGLRRLNQATRPWAVLISVLWLPLSLISFNVIGVLLSVYALYLLLSQKGKFVLSPEYQAVVLATPHMRYKTSRILLVLAIVLAVLVLLVITSGLWFNN